MRPRFEFALHLIPPGGEDIVAPGLALMGSLGWEIRGVTTTRSGETLVALQRPLREEAPLPDAPTLAASLEEPLVAPRTALLEDPSPN